MVSTELALVTPENYWLRSHERGVLIIPDLIIFDILQGGFYGFLYSISYNSLSKRIRTPFLDSSFLCYAISFRGSQKVAYQKKIFLNFVEDFVVSGRILENHHQPVCYQVRMFFDLI